MFRRKRQDTARLARVIENLEAHAEALHAQLVAASYEAELRYADMKRDRDYWREQAKGTK